jgi:uncharacterized membrane-anchored protein
MFMTESSDPRQTAYRVFGSVLAALLVFSLALLISAVVSVARGDADVYPNQHLILVALGLFQILIAASLLAQWRARYRRSVPALWFLTAAFGALAWSLVLYRS